MIDFIPQAVIKAVQHLWWNGAGITLTDRHIIAHKTHCSLDEVDAAIEFVRNERNPLPQTN